MPPHRDIKGSCMGRTRFFTQALLKGLRGKCDYDHNKEITVLELFKYIHADVTRRSLKGQHPQLIAPKGMHDKVIFRLEGIVLMFRH